MRRVLLLLIMLLLGLNTLSAQELTGTVYERQTGAPIPGVSVYLDGTSVATVTDSHGNFRLRPRNPVNVPLIFRHLSYEVAVVPEPFTALPDKIYLTERANEMEEVVVEPNPFSRKEMLNAFRENFLGMTRAGRSCTIENEEELELRYIPSRKTLFASSRQPLKIRNSFLGYDVLYDLIEFQMTVSGHNLSSASVVSYYGYSVFHDLKAGKNRYRKRRNEVYENTLPFFLKHLADGTLAHTPFEYSREIVTREPAGPETEGLPRVSVRRTREAFFDLLDSLPLRKIILRSPPKQKSLGIGLPEAEVFEEIRIRQRSKEGDKWSSLIFLNQEYWIDRYGNISPVTDLYNGGELGKRRAGDMLPLDFEVIK